MADNTDSDQRQHSAVSDLDQQFANVFHIMKTCLYNFDPLQPQFYIVKLGFTGVYIIFLISVQKT